ncbi:hypothetical protein [Thermococcus barophilus]|uniref:hypothetical protein n=1 Tax=Thermococcus barophilus TaxID=55802 RepID=UPI00130DE1FF|nr:hypothetical protein [Thermococcus barophilus]
MEYILSNYYLSKGYLVRILRGIYYVKTLEEYKLGKHLTYETDCHGYGEIGIRGYFGLYTALRLNGVTYEYYSRIFVITPVISRSRPVKVLGESVQFVKLKENLLNVWNHH